MLWAPTGGLRRTARALSCPYVTDLSELNVKFDVVIGNPPYNDSSTITDGSHRRRRENFVKQFVDLGLDLAKKQMIYVMPYDAKTYSSRIAEELRLNGLVMVSRASHYFPYVKSNIGVYYFDRQQVAEAVSDEFLDIGIEIPEQNIGEFFRRIPTNIGRNEFEVDLTDDASAKYTIHVTSSITKHTNDAALVARIGDPTQGNWRVAFNANGGMTSIGKVIVARPTDILSGSMSCLVMRDADEAARYQEYLSSDEINKQLMQKVKQGKPGNSKKVLQYAPQL